MTTNLDGSSELFLADVGRIRAQLDRAARQVSSGKRIQTVADAPDEIGSLLQLRSAQQHMEQIQSNLVLAKTDADTADGTLASCIKLMDRALTLATQGTSPAQTDETRRGIAAQIQSIQEQMVSFSCVAVQGRYIFSGDQSDVPPYHFDITSTNNAVIQNVASNANSRIEDPAGGSFANGKTAQEIFDTHNIDGTPAPNNVFRALNNLRLAVLSNNVGSITAAVDPLHQASAHLNRMEEFYGSVQARIQSSKDFAASYALRLKTEISEKEDADIVTATIEMTTANTHLQAAFQMRASMPHKSLFDYLG